MPAGNPTAATLIRKQDPKGSARAATTAALPANTRVGNVLTADANGALPSQDTVALAVGDPVDRLLVKDEVLGANNGIYDVTDVGSGSTPWVLTRSPDFTTDDQVTSGASTFVSEGTVNAGREYTLTTADSITVNTTSMTFSQTGGTTPSIHAASHAEAGADSLPAADGDEFGTVSRALGRIFVNALHPKTATPLNLEDAAGKVVIAIADGGALTIAPTTDTIFADGTGVIIGHTGQVPTGDFASELQVTGTAGQDTSITISRWSANSLTPVIQFFKSRNATIGSSTIVNDNDVIGRLSFFPDDGVDFNTAAAQFQAEVDDGSPAAGDIGMAFVWQQMPGGGGAIAETMRLSASGDLTLAVGGLVVTSNTHTTTAVIDVNAANSLALDGRIINLRSNSSDTQVRSLARILNDSTAAVGATVLEVRQDAAQRALFIDMNADGTALVIDSESTTSPCIDISSPETTTGIAIIMNALKLTTGKGLRIGSSSANTEVRNLVQFDGLSSAAVGQTILAVIQPAAQRALFIDMNGNGDGIVIDTEATTAAGGLVINADILTSGGIAAFLSNSSSGTARVLVQITNDHVDADLAVCLGLKQDASAEFIRFTATAIDDDLTQPLVAIADVGSTTIAGYIKVHIEDAGDQIPDGDYFIELHGSLVAA